jgi:hypothetical protein
MRRRSLAWPRALIWFISLVFHGMCSAVVDDDGQVEEEQRRREGKLAEVQRPHVGAALVAGGVVAAGLSSRQLFAERSAVPNPSRSGTPLRLSSKHDDNSGRVPWSGAPAPTSRRPRVLQLCAVSGAGSCAPAPSQLRYRAAACCQPAPALRPAG